MITCDISSEDDIAHVVGLVTDLGLSGRFTIRALSAYLYCIYNIRTRGVIYMHAKVYALGGVGRIEFPEKRYNTLSTGTRRGVFRIGLLYRPRRSSTLRDDHRRTNYASCMPTVMIFFSQGIRAE